MRLNAELMLNWRLSDAFAMASPSQVCARCQGTNAPLTYRLCCLKQRARLATTALERSVLQKHATHVLQVCCTSWQAHQLSATRICSSRPRDHCAFQ